MPNGKVTPMEINPKAIAVLMDVMSSQLAQLVDLKEKKEVEEFLKLAQFRDEISIALCCFLVYTNLIYNNFVQDISRDKLFLSPEEIEKYEKQIDKLDMSKFSMVDKNRDARTRELQPQTMEEKKKILSSVRNTIAHFKLKVIFDKKGNYENNMLIFGYENNNRQYNKIKCCDFLNFITNDLFVNYKKYDHNKIIAKDIYDVINQVSQKLK